MGTLDGRRILLGVSGSIAAYKAVDLLRKLQEQGAVVSVVMTKNAERFVSRLTFETLSGNPVPDAVFAEGQQPGIRHIEISDDLDAALVAPATANIIGKVSSGIADDTLTTVLTAIECPLVIAPAMNDRMYRNAVVARNISVLKELGVRFVEPESGSLACGTTGQGRLADAGRIIRELSSIFHSGELNGVRVLVTAGPTRERIDAVRFISNPSSGKMGFALAAEARDRGADVTLVSGPVQIAQPRGVDFVPVTSASEMHRAVLDRVPHADILIMAAAVSDFRPRKSSDRKIKKDSAPDAIELERTDDILADAAKLPGDRILVGFAAETDNLVDNAVRKLKEKDLDMIVANDLLKEGAGFGTDTNCIVMIERSGQRTELPLLSKRETASRILDNILELRKKTRISP